MVHDVERVEVCWSLSHHNSLCFRNSCPVYRQFAIATKWKAWENFSVRYRRKYNLYDFTGRPYQVTEYFSQTDFRRHSEVTLLRKTPLQLQWCSELRFIGQKSSPFKLKVMPLETFPGHKINNKNSFVIESNHVMLKSSDKSDDQQNKLGIVSSTRSDNNEFNDSKTSEKLIAALASFPGSGNTWLRYLLQQATGILTGSVYKDYGLLKSGFPAESIANSSVLLVKTHEWGSHVWSKFGKAILLVR